MRDGQPTYLYFVQHGDGGPIRIGCSANPWSVSHEMQTCTPVDLRLVLVTPGSRGDRDSWMLAFAHLHIHGAWYWAGHDLVDAIRSLYK